MHNAQTARTALLMLRLMSSGQWRRSVVKYGGQGQGQSGQAIKMFQITPYINDFQTFIYLFIYLFTVCQKSSM